MRFFRSESASEPVAPAVPPAAKPRAVEGWSEREFESVYSVAPIRHLAQHESLLMDVKGTESFFMILEGAIQVVVNWDDHRGRPGIFRKGEGIAPLPKSPGLQYYAEAVEPSTLIEITPSVMKLLPDKTQLFVFKIAVAATSRINAYIRSVNGEVSTKNTLLAAYIQQQNVRNVEALQSDFVRNFLTTIPRMPAYGMDLIVKLMDEHCTVQEIVDGIKTDPSLAGLLLRTVNSARFSFSKKIESFYHACMILGLDNIYTLLLQEAVQTAMPETESTKQIHRHSCLMTTICNEIASAANDPQAQTAATIGLLHDVGKGVQEVMKATHPERAGEIEGLQSAGLGAELLKLWGIPARICKVIEHQQQPEYMSPDSLPAEYQREAGILHIAHILESLLAGEPVAPENQIYTRDYMTLLRLPNPNPEVFLKETILPRLVRSKHRLPKQVLDILPV